MSLWLLVIILTNMKIVVKKVVSLTLLIKLDDHMASYLFFNYG